MIKFDKTDVMNTNNAMRGMRNPLNSWEKNDTIFNWNTCSYYIGENDLSLARKLIKAGPDHRKFLRQIFVSVDITAPLYWWKEFDQYKVGTTTNSCSTMHKIHAKEFTRDDFSYDRMSEDAITMLDSLVGYLESERVKFNETKDKLHWENIIQILPTSYNQTRTVTMTYETLLNQHRSRKHHKLKEWREYCMWAEKLPNFRELCLGGEVDEK